MVWSSYSVWQFRKQVAEYTLIWPQQTIGLKTLTKKAITVGIPLYRLNRLGYPTEVLNIEWVGDLETIKRHLLERGWSVQAGQHNFLQRFLESSLKYHLPIFPQLYHNKYPRLVLTRKNSQNDALLVLHLWQSDIELQNSKLPLWLGSVKYYQSNPKLLSLDGFKTYPTLTGALEDLAKDLKGFKRILKQYSTNQRPPEMARINWNGKLLVIQPK